MEPAPRNTSSLNRYACAGNISAALAGARDRYGNSACVVNGSTNGLCPQYGFDTSHNQINNTGYTYDASGDLSYDGNYTYHYDAEGRLAKVTSGTWYRTLVYNALGLRVADIVPDGTYIRTLTYPRDIFGDWTGIFDQRPSIGWTGWNEYRARVAGLRLSMGGSSSYLEHTDLPASTTMVTNQAGTVERDQLFYPWGQPWQQSGSYLWGNFGGLEPDVTYEQSYGALHRTYQKAVERWLTPDPLGGDVMNPQSLNRYAYVTSNPASMNDPLGLYGGNPGDPCSDPWYATSHAECGGPSGGPAGGGWDMFCGDIPFMSCPGGPRALGGSATGPFTPPPPPVPPGQPPMAGEAALGEASSTAPGIGIIDLTSVWIKVISRLCGGNKLCMDILLGGGPLVGAINPWSPQAIALKAKVNNPKGTPNEPRPWQQPVEDTRRPPTWEESIDPEMKALVDWFTALTRGTIIPDVGVGPIVDPRVIVPEQGPQVPGGPY